MGLVEEVHCSARVAKVLKAFQAQGWSVYVVTGEFVVMECGTHADEYASIATWPSHDDVLEQNIDHAEKTTCFRGRWTA